MKINEMLTSIRKDARQKYTELSKDLSISVTRAFQIHKATESRYITKYATLVDFSKLGFAMHYFFQIKGSFALTHPCINTVYNLGKKIYLVEAYFKDYAQYHEFVESYQRFIVRQIPVMENVKEESFLTN